jgi:hypothetical protein
MSESPEDLNRQDAETANAIGLLKNFCLGILGFLTVHLSQPTSCCST